MKTLHYAVDFYSDYFKHLDGFVFNRTHKRDCIVEQWKSKVYKCKSYGWQACFTNQNYRNPEQCSLTITQPNYEDALLDIILSKRMEILTACKKRGQALILPIYPCFSLLKRYMRLLHELEIRTLELESKRNEQQSVETEIVAVDVDNC